MSSFIISKNDFVKMGALIGAFTEIEERHEPYLYVWNDVENRLSNQLDVVNELVKVYEYNVHSFCLQYHETDKEEIYLSEEYDKSILANAKKFAKGLLYHERQMLETMFEMKKFIRSVNYQIEDVESNNASMEILNKYFSLFVDVVAKFYPYECQSWGSFEVGF